MAQRPVLPAWLLRAAVLVSGAVVLVVETLAARLVAPWVGLTLESHTAAIGVALAGIAAGAAVGGRLADAAGPRHVVVGGLALGGVLVLTVRPLVDLAGPLVGGGPAAALLLVAVSTVAPVAVLSAVAPAVARASLRGLDGAGTVYGSVSALGTVGALAGTALTGMLLVALLPLGWALAAAAAVCLGLAAAVAWTGRPRPPAGAAARSAAAATLAALALVAVPERCDVDTTYHCASVVTDPDRPGGRSLVLDDLRHSYVDLDDPAHLELVYVQRIADAVDASAPAGRPLDAVHLGGGGLTLPRWLAVTRPGSRSTVLEVDAGVVRLAREELGAADIPGTDVVVGDARASLRQVRADSADVVVGDAFGARAVPWHLATRELVADVDRVLRPGGVYVVNVIDHEPRALLAAVTATAASVLPHVAVISTRGQLGEGGGGNHVVVASSRPLDLGDLAARVAARGDVVVAGPELAALVGDAPLLTDDYAPTDQLLTVRRG